MRSLLRFQVGYDGFLKRFGVHFPGKVHRALAVNRVPSGRVGTAVELNFQAYADGGFLNRHPDDFACRLPSRAAGRAPFDGHGIDFALCNRYLELRGAKPVAVFTQAVLPGKPASGGRGGYSLYFGLFTGGHDGNSLFTAHLA